jgi:Leucine-rich repeat (LRR) protein
MVLFLAQVKYSTELYFITELVTQEQLCNWKINNATDCSDYEFFVNCNMDPNMLYLLLTAISILLFLKMPWQNRHIDSIIIIACYAYKQ